MTTSSKRSRGERERERGMEGIGKSLLVPSVQDVAKETLTTNIVPPRYLQNSDPLLPCDDAAAYLQIPIISMEALISGDPKEHEKLHSASQEWGFFQLVDHGVSSSLVERFKKETKEFFNMPIEVKEKYWQTPKEFEGFGQNFVLSEEQKLDWADIFFMVTLPKHLRKAHLLPMFPLPFRDTVEEYSSEMENLAMRILNRMAKALEIDTEEMKELFNGGMQSMRMNYYPQCPESNKVIGLTPHSDTSALTILLQLNEMDGLQIRKEGRWIPVSPLPGAFVVNIGDIMEIVSNGIYHSIEHRAAVNPTKERLSVATFLSPPLEKEFGPASSLITPQSPARFIRIKFADYLKGFFARPLDGKSYLDVMKVENNRI
ncbi:hypothetical protein Ancab_034124 [Ancistrocladus abbreviatus]